MEEVKAKQEIDFPVIFIMGTTASGKSKLGDDLLKVLSNSHIVNADAFQIYKDVKIMTAAPDLLSDNLHLYNFVDLMENQFSVINYENVALKEIQRIGEAMKGVPIIVGGTNYYIDRIMFKKKIEEGKIAENGPIKTKYADFAKFESDLKEFIAKNPKNAFSPIQQENLLKMHEFIKTAEILNNSHTKVEDIELHTPSATETSRILLSIVDPIMTEYFHPNDLRRILTSVVKFYKTLCRESDERINESRELRYKNMKCIAIKASMDILKVRIEKRSDIMLREGGLREILMVFNKFSTKYGSDISFGSGIMQAIGYKELYDVYLEMKKVNDPLLLEYPQKSDKEIYEHVILHYQAIYIKCFNRLSAMNLKYAKSQLKWIKRIRSEIPKDQFLEIELNDLKDYEEKCFKVGYQFVSNPLKELIKESKKESRILTSKQILCEVCQKYYYGEENYKEHLKTKKHKRIVQKSKQELEFPDISFSQRL